MQVSSLIAPAIIAAVLGAATAVIAVFFKLLMKRDERKPEPKLDTSLLRASVMCMGVKNVAPDEAKYEGFPTCASAKPFFEGPKGCKLGCIGLGDCAAACPAKAIDICNGLAIVDRNKCTGCGVCRDACPQHIIRLYPKSQTVLPLCSSKEPAERKVDLCAAGCTACGACIAICPFGAIAVKGTVARIDAEKCVSCGKCAEVCPRKCIAVFQI